jgi:hypothetical protein
MCTGCVPPAGCEDTGVEQVAALTRCLDDGYPENRSWPGLPKHHREPRGAMVSPWAAQMTNVGDGVRLAEFVAALSQSFRAWA